MSIVDESNVKALIGRVKDLSGKVNDLNSIVMGFDNRIKSIEATLRNVSETAAVDARVSKLKDSCEIEFSRLSNEVGDALGRIRRLETDPLRV